MEHTNDAPACRNGTVDIRRFEEQDRNGLLEITPCIRTYNERGEELVYPCLRLSYGSLVYERYLYGPTTPEEAYKRMEHKIMLKEISANLYDHFSELGFSVVVLNPIDERRIAGKAQVPPEAGDSDFEFLSRMANVHSMLYPADG